MFFFLLLSVRVGWNQLNVLSTDDKNDCRFENCTDLPFPPDALSIRIIIRKKN